MNKPFDPETYLYCALASFGTGLTLDLYPQTIWFQPALIFAGLAVIFWAVRR